MEVEVVGDAVERIEFKPFPKQAEFLSLPTSIKEGFFGGAAGPGKSWCLLMDPLMRRLHEHPRFHGIVFRETFRQLEESLVFESQHLYPLVGGRYNGQDYCWTFPSGAKIRFSYLARDEQVYDHDTAQYNYAAYDELTAFTRFRYMYIVHSRVRTTVKGLPAYARSASNPLGIGHSWVKERFIAPAKDGGKIIREIMPDGAVNKRIFIKARVTDNPILMKENPEYINSLMLLPEAEKRSKLYGDWDAIAGQVFTEFRSELMPDEPSNALHIIKPYVIPDYWPVILSVDWGYDAMTFGGFFAISPEERVIHCEEFSAVQTKIKVWGADLGVMARRYPNLKTPITLDKSAWAERGDEQTIAEQVEDAIGLPVEKSDSDRVGGKMLFHEYLRFRQKPPRYVPPGGYDPSIEEKLYRIKGEKAALEYRHVFDPEPPEVNLPKLQIFDTCKLLPEALISCVSNPDKPNDVLPFPGDDPYDGSRYALKRVARYFEESKEGHREFIKKDQIIENLRKTGDMTAFYREMENLEEQELSRNTGVRRYNTYGSPRRSFRASR